MIIKLKNGADVKISNKAELIDYLSVTKAPMLTLVTAQCENILTFDEYHNIISDFLESR